MNDRRYRSLNPDSKLILNNRGSAFALQPKKRLLETGETRTYWAANSLEQAMRNLYKRCGLHGCSSHSECNPVNSYIKQGSLTSAFGTKRPLGPGDTWQDPAALHDTLRTLMVNQALNVLVQISALCSCND